MKIYRVTFQTELLVEAETEEHSIKLGSKFLKEEVLNGTSDLIDVELINSKKKLKLEEINSIPWRDPSIKRDKDYYVEEILEENIGE